eukprot:CAMPEP_0197497356 /NCGR_PEP_ID=MMETSP1311-20131121/50706_1 /TAXON_ID=464262 /ORGANISM="Genus nov. species nov., Strain RCC856" /LENGTH=250 /DNA_ID=CAMNT_0043043013 /DNA_START=19 /DNA_END=768 /DNA_ORIENTATION=+
MREAGAKISRLSASSSACLRASVLDCTQSFASVTSALVETAIACGVEASAGGRVAMLVDCAGLCCRLECEGFGVHPDLALRDENLKVLTQFAVVQLVTRPRGSLETVELLWQGGNLASRRQSRHVLPSYGSWIIARDLMRNIPVRRNLLAKTPKGKHLALLRSKLFPIVASNGHLSFDLSSWGPSKQAGLAFEAEAGTPTPLLLLKAFGIDRRNLVQIRAAAEGVEISLYYLKDWRLQQDVLFEHVLVNG